MRFGFEGRSSAGRRSRPGAAATGTSAARVPPHRSPRRVPSVSVGADPSVASCDPWVGVRWPPPPPPRPRPRPPRRRRRRGAPVDSLHLRRRRRRATRRWSRGWSDVRPVGPGSRHPCCELLPLEGGTQEHRTAGRSAAGRGSMAMVPRCEGARAPGVCGVTHPIVSFGPARRARAAPGDPGAASGRAPHRFRPRPLAHRASGTGTSVGRITAAPVPPCERKGPLGLTRAEATRQDD